MRFPSFLFFFNCQRWDYIIAYAALQAFLKNFPAISACGIPDNSHTIPGYVLGSLTVAKVKKR